MRFLVVSLSLVLSLPAVANAQFRHGPRRGSAGIQVHPPVVQRRATVAPGPVVGINPVPAFGVNPGFANPGFRGNRTFHRRTPVIGPAIPYFSYFPYSYPYSPYPYSPIVTPYVPEPYVPEPYIPSPYVDPMVYQNNDRAIDALNDQVQQLHGQVEELQQELEVAKQPPPTPAAPAMPPTPVVLVFRNGQRIETQGYAIVGPTLWILSSQGTKTVELARLDVDATREENLKRGITFRLPATP
jgi:hypothetical protein